MIDPDQKSIPQRVILEFDGSFATGFRVTLNLGDEGKPPRRRRKGRLPAATALLAQLEHHWQEIYRPLGAPYSRFWRAEESATALDFRIKPKRILTKGPLKEQIEACHKSAQNLQAALNQWLNSESFREIDRTLREELSPKDTVRMLLHTDDLQFQKLPWEEWNFFDSYPQAVPSFSPLESKIGVKLPPIANIGTVRILAILGHSGGINVERDRALIQQLPYAEVVFLEQPTAKAISDRLWHESWDILFFAGHSETQGEQGILHISPTESITIEQLWYTLRRAVDQGLQLAIFNSCDGLGLSQQLDDDLHIPQMILMKELVPDCVAHQFLTYFLQAFAQGDSLYGSVRQAREKLHDELESTIPCSSWLPVICQNPLVLPPSWEQLVGLEPELVSASEPVAVPEPEPQPQQRPQRSWRWSFVMSVLVAIAVIFIRSWGWLQPLEWWAYDTMLRSRPIEAVDDRLAVVEITPELQSLPEYKQNSIGSINDELLYQLLQKLETYQPRAIGFYRPQDDEFDAQTPELQNYLKNTDHFYGICALGEPGQSRGVPGSAYVPTARQGFEHISPDQDGVVRRQVLMVSPLASACQTDNEINLKLAEYYFEGEGITWSYDNQTTLQYGKPNNVQQTQFQQLKSALGFYHSADTGAYQILVNYRTQRGLTMIAPSATAFDVISGYVSERMFRDRIVLIAVHNANTPTHQTPWGTEIPGFWIQTHMISQVLSAVLDGRPLLKLANPMLSIFWVGLWLIATGIALTQSTKTSLNSGAVLLGIAAMLTVLAYILFLWGMVVPIVPSMLGGILLWGIWSFSISKSKFLPHNK